MSHFAESLEKSRKRNSVVKPSIHERTYAGAGSLGFMSTLSQQQLMSQHEEQLQHLVGFAGAIIRTIGNGIAGQTFHVGRKKAVKSNNKTERVRQKQILSLMPKTLQTFSENVEMLTEHTLLETVNKPNPLMGKFALIQNTFMCLETCGIMHWWFRFPNEENDLDHVQIWPLPPSWVEPIHQQGTMFHSFRVCPTGFVSPIIIPGRNIGTLYYPDPANPIRPLSPMQMFGREVMVDEQISETKRRHFLNGHNPGLAVIVGKMPGMEGIAGADVVPILTKDQRNQITDALNQDWRGAVNFNNPIILDGMIKDVKKVTATVQEMDYLSSGEAAQKRLAQCWGVSPTILGDMQNANRAGSTVAKKHFYDIVLNPRIAMFSEALTHQIAPLFLDDEKEDVLAWLEIPVATDEDYELAKHEAMIDRDCETINEWRHAMGYEPWPDGDVPVSQWRSDRGFTPTPSLRITEDESDVPDKRLALTHHKSWHDRLGAHGHVRTLDRHASKTERELAEAMQKFFIEMGQSVGDSLRNHAKSSTMIDPSLIDTLVHDSEWTDKMSAVAEPIMLKAGLASALVEWNMHQPRKPKSRGDLSTKGVFDFALKLPVSIVAAVTQNISKLIEGFRAADILETVRDKIKKVIAAIGAAISPAQVADKVVGTVFSNTETASHAQNVARTENTGAIGAGGKAAQDELGRLGIVNGRKWMTMRDDVVRPTHVAAGKLPAISLHEKFVVGGCECEYPGDRSLPAKELCNCFLPGTAVDGRYEAMMRSWYEGEAVEVVTGSRRLSLTPNHPVLTSRGWVLAGELDSGDEIISYGCEIDNLRVASTNQVNDMPTSVEKVFESFMLRSVAGLFAPIECRRADVDDFHGDGQGIKGDINVVTADRKLLKYTKAGSLKENTDSVLQLELAKLFSENRQSGLGKLVVGLGSPSTSLPRLGALPLDGSPVGLHDGPFDSLRFGTSPDLDTGSKKCFYDGHPGNADLFRELIDRNARVVSCDKIVQVRKFDFCGHVYCLQSTNGLVISNNIVTSNCRCYVISVKVKR